MQSKVTFSSLLSPELCLCVQSLVFTSSTIQMACWEQEKKKLSDPTWIQYYVMCVCVIVNVCEQAVVYVFL